MKAFSRIIVIGLLCLSFACCSRAKETLGKRTLEEERLMLYQQGRYAEGIAVARKYLKRTEEMYYPNSLMEINPLIWLAYFNQEQGKYAEAERLLQKALKISERYVESERLLQRALGMPESDIGLDNVIGLKNGWYMEACLSRLALLYGTQGKYSEAEPLIQRALELNEKAHGPDHLAVGKYLNNLASLYYFQKKYTQAEPLFQRALKIHEKIYGTDHPYVATCLNNLAVIYERQGKYSEAEPLHQRSLRIREKKLGVDHPDVAICLRGLAKLEAARGRLEVALLLMVRSLLIEERTMDNVFSLASEREKFVFFDTVPNGFGILQSLVAQELATDPEAVLMALDAALRRKGLILDALSRERMALLASGDPQVTQTARQLQDTVSQLAGLTLAGPGKLSPDVYKSRLAELEAEKERLEEELANLSGAYAVEKQSRQVNAELVARAMKPGSALVEYVGYRIYDFHAKGTEKKWKEYRYLAFVLPAGQEANPMLVDLGKAEDIDKAVQDFHQEMANAGETIARVGEAEAERQLAEKGKRIYDLAFAPLRSAIGDSAVLYIAPDGELNLISFGALPDKNGSYLAENYQFNYLSSGRDLMRFAPAAVSSTGAVVMANPDYNSFGAEAIPQPQGDSPLLAMRGAARSMDLKQVVWPPLPGTRREGEAVVKELSGEQVRLYLDAQASEEVVKGVQAPRILHLATHGFFLDEQDKPEPQEGMDAFRSVKLVGISSRPAPAAMKIENPLLRSGLVFAGANHLGKGVLPDGADDGILTALEVSGMSLWGTDLVVLSACETAVGKSRQGEGVFGLRRAFHLAGARTIVMSQWEIPDEETVTLMTDFYSRWQSVSGKSQALREASLSLMRERRKQNGAAHPYYWGAFVCVGEP